MKTPQHDAFWKLYHPGDTEHIQDGGTEKKQQKKKKKTED